MCVNKTQSPEGLPAYRIIIQCRDKYAVGVTDDYMGYCTGPVCEDTYLFAYISRQFGKVSCRFLGYELIRRELPAVNPLQRLKPVLPQTGYFAVYRCDIIYTSNS